MTTYTAYNGSTETNSIYAADDKVFYVYKGSQLVWRLHQYSSNQVLFESSTPNTYTLEILDDGVYNVICVGGGGGGASSRSDDTGTGAGGGSGGYSNETIYLTKGTYSVIVGQGGAQATSWRSAYAYGGTGGDSSFGGVVGGGGGGGTAYRNGWVSIGGAGGTGSTTTGNTGYGESTTYTPSVYEGYGRGGWGYGSTSTNARNGESGYVKITYIRDSL